MPIFDPTTKHNDTMKEQITAELKGLGMYTAPGSLSDALADKMVSQISAIKFYMAEGCDELMKRTISESTFGPAIRSIVSKYVAK